MGAPMRRCSQRPLRKGAGAEAEEPTASWRRPDREAVKNDSTALHSLALSFCLAALHCRAVNPHRLPCGNVHRPPQRPDQRRD